MGRANRSSERPFVPGSSFLLRKPPLPSTPSIATSNASRIPKSYLHPNTFPADGNALSKSAKSCVDFVSPKFSPGTMEYFAARRSLIGLAFNPNFHFRSIAALEKLVLRRPRFLPPGLPWCQGYCFRGRTRFVPRFKKIATGEERLEVVLLRSHWRRIEFKQRSIFERTKGIEKGVDFINFINLWRLLLFITLKICLFPRSIVWTSIQVTRIDFW